MKINFWFGLLISLFLLLSVGGVIGGSVMIFKNIDLRLFGEKTTALIVDTEISSSLNDRDYKHTQRTYVYPIVEYTVDGKLIRSKSHSSANKIKEDIGDEIAIVYRKSEPDYFALQVQLNENLLAGSVCIIIGGLFTTIFTVIIVHAYKDRKMEREKKLFEEHNFQSGTSKKSLR
ncbi:MAG: hypothetical protein K0S44_1933 [Bacteroidetes bacterium]|jgi:hypothetical protein|nr:hypothetical protein [Bacteroidota bacterium]